MEWLIQLQGQVVGLDTAPLIENLGLKPRRSTTALLLNISAFTKYSNSLTYEVQ
jgi:hypothetical protein